MAARRLEIEFIGDTVALEKSFNKVGGSAKQVGTDVDAGGKKTKSGLSTMKNAAIGAGIAFGVAGLAGGVKSAIGAFEESRKIGRQTDAVIKATGGSANVTAKQVGALASALSKKTGIDDEAIQTGSNLLLTFKNVRNETGKGRDIFNQATAAALDLSKSGFGSVDSASKMLGKALNDPVKGVTALSRAGVQLTDDQKKQIKSLTATGKASDRLKAQQIILKEVQGQVGGSAEAQATSTDKLKVTLGNLQESVGGLLVPALDAAAGALDVMLGFLQDNKPVAIVLATAIGLLTAGLIANAAASAIATAATTLWSGVTKTAAAAQWLLNAALTANPIALVVLAIVGLIGAFVLAYTKIDWFRNGVDTAFAAIKTAISTAFDWVKNNWPLLLGIITGPIGMAVVQIAEHWDEIKTAAGKAWDAIKSAIMTPVDALTSAVRAAVGENGLRGWISGVWDGIKTTATTGWNAIKSVVMTPVDALVSAVKGALGENGLRKWLGEAWDGIKSTATTAWSGFKDILMTPINEAVSAVKGALGLTEGLRKWLGDTWDGIVDGITGKDGFAGKLKSGLESAIGSVATVVIGFVRAVIDAINFLPGVPNIKKPDMPADPGSPAKAAGLARGGAFGVTGGLISSPITMMGEEAPHHPEFVIPTNPAYRNRAQGLLAQAAGAIGLAKGGIFGDIGNAVKGVASSAWDSVTDLIPNMPGLPKIAGWATGIVKWIAESVAPWAKKNAGPTKKMQAFGDRMAAKNMPYVYGGGHGGWGEGPFDCSGFVSAILHAGDLLSSPQSTDGLKAWGQPGDGKQITVGVRGSTGPNAHTNIKVGDKYYESGGGGNGAHVMGGWNGVFPIHRHPEGLAMGGLLGSPGAITKLSEQMFPPSEFGWGLKNGGVYGPYVGTFHNGGIVPSDGLANVQAGERVFPADGFQIELVSNDPLINLLLPHIDARISERDRQQGQYTRARVSG